MNVKKVSRSKKNGYSIFVMFDTGKNVEVAYQQETERTWLCSFIIFNGGVGAFAYKMRWGNAGQEEPVCNNWRDVPTEEAQNYLSAMRAILNAGDKLERTVASLLGEMVF